MEILRRNDYREVENEESLHQEITTELLKFHSVIKKEEGRRGTSDIIVALPPSQNDSVKRYVGLSRLEHDFSGSSSIMCFFYDAMPVANDQIPHAGTFAKNTLDGGSTYVRLTGFLASKKTDTAQLEEICAMLRASLTPCENSYDTNLLYNR